jgi:hypothetical protein
LLLSPLFVALLLPLLLRPRVLPLLLGSLPLFLLAPVLLPDVPPLGGQLTFDSERSLAVLFRAELPAVLGELTAPFLFAALAPGDGLWRSPEVESAPSGQSAVDWGTLLPPEPVLP